jgi:thioesterase domain-containing protein
VYFPPGVLGEVMVSDELRDALPDDVPLYALREIVDDGPRAESMDAMAARFAAAIRAFQPEGPICLAGYSFGGLLAYEMARQLKASGRDIRLLAIFDTGPDFSKGGSLKDRWTRVRLCLQNVPRWIEEDVIRSFGPETPARLWRSVLKLAGALIWRRFHAAATPGSFARVEHLFDVSNWSPALYAHVENNLRILGAFRYRGYDGQLTLFRARVRPLFHAHTWDLGWQTVARDVRVVETPGNHHTLMQVPHIRVLGQKLRDVLDDGSSPIATPGSSAAAPSA